MSRQEKFDLFRLTVHPTAPLYPPDDPKSVLLEKAILESPRHETRGLVWSFANVERIEGERALHFRFGRTGIRSLPRKSRTGDFVDERIDIAPFVDVVVDLDLEVCALGDRR